MRDIVCSLGNLSGLIRGQFCPDLGMIASAREAALDRADVGHDDGRTRMMSFGLGRPCVQEQVAGRDPPRFSAKPYGRRQRQAAPPPILPDGQLVRPPGSVGSSAFCMSAGRDYFRKINHAKRVIVILIACSSLHL